MRNPIEDRQGPDGCIMVQVLSYALGRSGLHGNCASEVSSILQSSSHDRARLRYALHRHLPYINGFVLRVRGEARAVLKPLTDMRQESS